MMKSKNTFAASEDGSATVEVVIWLPFIMALFTLMVDASVMFHNHSSVTRMVQDANRAYAVGRYETEVETQTELSARLADLSGDADVQTTLSNGVINTVVTVPAADLDVIGVFPGMSDFLFTIRAQHFQET